MFNPLDVKTYAHVLSMDIGTLQERQDMVLGRLVQKGHSANSAYLLTMASQVYLNFKIKDSA